MYFIIKFEILALKSIWKQNLFLYCDVYGKKHPEIVEDMHNSWYTQPRVVYIFNYKMFHQEASVEIIKMTRKYTSTS